MKCPYCGKELAPETKFCDGCGAKMDETPKTINTVPVTDNMQSYSESYQNNPSNNNNKNKGLKITIIILSILLIAGLVFFVWFAFIRDDDKAKKDNDDEIAENNKDTDLPNGENNNNNNNNNNSNNVGSSKETVLFENYTLTVPSGFTHDDYDGRGYIQNSECIIMYDKYPATYNQIVDNKEYFTEAFETYGFIVDSFTTKTMNGIDYVIMTGNIAGISYAYMFADLDDTTTIFLTISSVSLGSFDSNWLNYGSEFVSSAK